MVEWVLESLTLLPEDLIRKSVKVCALNLVVDGSKDNLIHCFKEESQLIAWGNLSLTKNQFQTTDQDMEEFLLLDLSDDECDFVNI